MCKLKQIQINQIIGKSFEEACLNELKKSYDKVEKQISLYYKTTNGTIKSFRPDFIIYNKDGEPIHLIEAKSSATASFTENQYEGYLAVANGSAYYDSNCTSLFPKILTIVMYPSDSNPQIIEQIHQRFNPNKI
jgi:hypothetical protein